MVLQQPRHSHPPAPASSMHVLRCTEFFALCLLLVALGWGISSCALGRSYCLSDTDCKPGYLCIIAQCALTSSDGSPNEKLPPDGQEATPEISQETDPSDASEAPQEIDPNDMPVPDGTICVDGATRPCDLSNDPDCTQIVPNHYKCQNSCNKGAHRCVDGQWSLRCDAPYEIGTEICDGIDNDCNGQVDESLKSCLATMLRLTNPGNGQAIGLALDPKAQFLYTAAQNASQSHFFLKRIQLPNLQQANLAVVPNPSTLPRSYQGVTALALHAAPAQPILYFTENNGCILYKATLRNTVATVERLGDGVCRPAAATLYTSPIVIQNARFIDITSLAVHQATGKLYIAEKTDQLLHVFDPQQNTLQTLHASEKDDLLCLKSPALSLLSVAADIPATERIFLLHQHTATEAGIFSFAFGTACTNTPLRIVPDTGLLTPTTFAPVSDEKQAATAFYFSQHNNTTPPSICGLFRGALTKTQLNAPVALLQGACEIKDGLANKPDTSTAQVGQISSMTWHPTSSHLYFLDQATNGATHLRRLTAP